MAYWVGGSGNWNDAANHWSDVSGGSPGAGNLPSSTVDAIFDANSFSSDSQTVTINAANCACANLDFFAIDQTVTFANSANNDFKVYGNLVLHATKLTWTFTGTGYCTLAGTGSQTITTNGMASNMNRLYFDGVGGTWTNQDACNLGSTYLYLKNGTWNTNNFNVTTTGRFITEVGTKTLTLGSSVFTVSYWNNDQGTNFTFNYNTSTVKITGSSTLVVGTSSTFYNLSFETSIADIIFVQSNFTVNNVLTITGNNDTNYRLLVASNTIGTQRTITAASLSASNVDFRDIKLAGACSKDLSAITGGSGDCGGNTDITFSTPETKYYKHTSGACTWKDTTKWVTESGGSTTSTARFLPQDSHILDANSFTGTSTLTIDVPRKGSVDMSAVTQNVSTVLANAVEHYGHLILGNNITPSGSYVRILMGRGNYDLNLYGKTVYQIYHNSFSGIYTNLSNFTTDRYYNYSGNINFGSYIIELTNSSLFYWLAGTLNAGTSTIKLNPTSVSSNLFFDGAGKTYYNVWFSGSHTGYFDISGSNTFNELKIDPGRKVRVTAGTTQTVSKLNAVGTQANPIYLTSVTSATHTFAYTGTDPVNVNWCDISYSIVPVNKFYANNSLNRASNTNWIFNINSVFSYNANNGSYYSNNGILGVATGDPIFVQKEKGTCIKLESGKSLTWTIPSAFISDIVTLTSGIGTLRITCGATNTDIAITGWENNRSSVVYSAITTVTITATSGYVYLLGLYLYNNIDITSLNNIAVSYNQSEVISSIKRPIYPKARDLSAFTNMTIGNGLLYNWYAVAGIDGTGVTKSLAPAGCHIPSSSEWTTLSNYLGGDSVSGGKLKSINSIFWTTPNVGADNSSGFFCFAAGYRLATGVYGGLLIESDFWSSNQFSETLGIARGVFLNLANTTVNNYSKALGISTRCICDTPYFLGQVITDVDGNRYGTVKIGDQTWLTSNLKTTKYADGTSIPNVTVNGDWAALTTGAYCSYNNAAIVEISQPFSINGLKAAYSFIPENKKLNILSDISGNGKNGTITSAMMTKSKMAFDGINDKVVFGNLGYPNTICFRIKLSTTTQKIIEGKANANLIYVSSGTLTSTEFAYKYVDGVLGSTMVANQWQNVVLVSTTGIEFSATTLGLNNVTYGKFEIEDLRFYNHAFTATQAKNYHNSFVKPVFVEEFKYDGIGDFPKGWKRGTGNGVIKQTSTTKYLECTTAGTIKYPVNAISNANSYLEYSYYDGQVTKKLHEYDPIPALSNQYITINLARVGDRINSIKLFPNLVQDNWYGVEWDITNSSPECTRIGDLSLHVTLPVHSLIKGCLLLDNGTVNYYLKEDDWTKKADGTASNLDGTDGQVMVEIPNHYRRFEMVGNKQRVKVSLFELPGFTKVDKVYVSAYEASLNRSTSKLSSVVNITTTYRGGDNTSAWDALDKTLLGKPVTSINRTNYRTYARNRGTGWEMYTYEVHKTLAYLYTIEYATLDSQKAYDATLTAEGYKKGGLGDGVTTVNSTLWNSWNSYNPFMNCGHSNSLANLTGYVDYSMPAGYGASLTVPSIRYRGVEHPFGHIWKNMDGITVIAQAIGYDLSEHQVWITSNRSLWQDGNITSYSKIGTLPRSYGYISRMISGHIMPDVAIGKSTTYWCDHFYQSIPESSQEVRTVLFGGSAHSDSPAGFGCSSASNSPSYTLASLGSRLCYYPA